MGRASAVILAGGRSSRMGYDKAFLELDSRPIIKRQIEELSKAFDPVLVVCNQPELYAGLGVQLVQDQYPGYGPLAGIHAGLKGAPGDAVFVVPCDLPFVTAELGAQMLERLGSADGLVLTSDGKLEPLCAVYRKSCLPVIEEYLVKKRLKVIDFYPMVNILLLPAEELVLGRPVEQVLFNINTPDDFARARVLGES